MKAIVYRNYGPPGVLRYEEVEKPVPKPSQVLLKVRAAGLNPLDWHFMRGEPYAVRIIAGLGHPKFAGLGVDVAGEVEAVGAQVTQFKPGDAVFGSCRGAFAEYACTSEAKLVTKPENVTFEQAAGVHVAAFTALQGLRDKGHIQPGQKVLINGASGGVGTFAVQIAKWYPAVVTGVCSTRNLELVRSIGADHVIDYTQEDFTTSESRYDIILDCVGNHSLSACRRVLQPNGRLVMAGGEAGKWMLAAIGNAIKAKTISTFSSQKLLGMLARPSQDDLRTLRGLMKDGKVKTVIDRCYSLNEAPEAIRYLEERHARGKVVIVL
jgi:NADPH:quinone reductase-like Zn-dependent oxidoreductase